MNRWLITVTLVLLLGAGFVQAQDDPAPGAASAGDSLYPGLGNLGYDVGHYTLEITLDMDGRAITGRATLEATAVQALSAFNLDLEGLDVTRVLVNGLPAIFERSGRELTITPAVPIPAGAPFTVLVEYGGQPRPIADASLGASIGLNFTGNGAYVASEPDGAATWFPSNDHPSDKATYTFVLTVPEGVTAVANGVLVGSETTDGATTFTWAMRQPMASYLATMAAGDFTIVSGDPAGEVTIRNVFPTPYAEEGTAAFDQQDEMLAFFADTFGPYPFDEYGALVVPQSLGFALETQSLSLFGLPVILEGLSGAGRSEEVIAHEMAHSWFGDALSLAGWSDIWLNEGFATYASWLWFEHTRGPQAMESLVRDSYAQLSGQALLDAGYNAEAAQAMMSRIAGAPGDPPANNLFNMAVYLRGAVTLHALRLAVGDEVFFAILRAYYETHAYRNVTTADFIAVAEDVSGRDLTAFFEAWIYDTAIPPLKALGLNPAF